MWCASLYIQERTLRTIKDEFQKTMMQNQSKCNLLYEDVFRISIRFLPQKLHWFSPAGRHRSLTETPKLQCRRPQLSTIVLWPSAYMNHFTSLTISIYVFMTATYSTLLNSSYIWYLYTLWLYYVCVSASIY